MKTAIQSFLSSSIHRYLELKQALGRDFANERRVLLQIDEFMGATGTAELTQAEFEGWCKTQLHLSPGVRRNRMRIVRNFCLYRRRTELLCPRRLSLSDAPSSRSAAYFLRGGDRALSAGQRKTVDFATLHYALTGFASFRGLALHHRITPWGIGAIDPRRL
jgi:hypothetical protein